MATILDAINQSKDMIKSVRAAIEQCEEKKSEFESELTKLGEGDEHDERRTLLRSAIESYKAFIKEFELHVESHTAMIRTNEGLARLLGE